jgi:glycosyltransferase involved in cell wall biosynthesis
MSTYLESRKLGIDFDVVEYPDWFGEGWLLGLTRVYPSVAHLHTPLPIIAQHNEMPSSVDTKCASRLERLAVERADMVTSPSQLLIDSLRRIGWLKSARTRTIPHSIDWPCWADSPSPASTTPLALYVGRMEPRKAPELLVKALEIIANEVPGATGLFIGRSNGARNGVEYSQWLRSLASASGLCKLIPEIPRKDLIRYLSQARVFVLPSRYDSYGLAAIEAMAAGRPVVISDTVGCSELVEGTEAGRTFPSGNAEALAEALKPFLRDSAYSHECGDLGRRLVRRVNDPMAVARQRVDVYEDAIRSYRNHGPSGSTHHAIMSQVGNLLVPDRWREWASQETIREPWRHFYPRTAQQLLQFIAQHPRFSHRQDLSGLRILDAGCTPAVSVMLAMMGAAVTLVDLSPQELEKGLIYSRGLHCEDRMRVVQADVFCMPFREQSFDIVWNNGFIEHFDNPATIVHEMKAHLAPAGALIVLVPNSATPHSWFIRDRLRRRVNGYYWDFMGKERSFSVTGLTNLVQETGLRVYAASAGNLRRSLLDDSIALPILCRKFPGSFLMGLFRIMDCVEDTFPLTRNWGFMSGVGACRVQELSSSRLERPVLQG